MDLHYVAGIAAKDDGHVVLRQDDIEGTVLRYVLPAKELSQRSMLGVERC